MIDVLRVDCWWRVKLTVDLCSLLFLCDKCIILFDSVQCNKLIDCVDHLIVIWLIFWTFKWHFSAFSALTLLVEQQEEHLTCKHWVMRCWHGYLSEVRCKWFACGPADATATPFISCFIKIQNGLPFWCRLTQVVLEKRPLIGFSS